MSEPTEPQQIFQKTREELIAAISAAANRPNTEENRQLILALSSEYRQ